MIIIADGGSTKTNWCLVTEEGKKVYFNTEGYNPYVENISNLEILLGIGPPGASRGICVRNLPGIILVIFFYW